MKFSKIRRALVAAALTPLALAGLPARAQETTALKMVLDWKMQGIHAWYFLAQDRGYFARERIDLSIDQGDGSATAVTKVVTGTYQVAVGDFNAIVQASAMNAGQVPVMVYMLYNRPPFAIMTKATSPIRSLKDLEGKSIGSPAGGSAMKLFPVLAAKNRIDAGKVTWMNMAPNLQEQMLLKDQVDAAAVFTVTSYMNLVTLRQDPDKDIRWFDYADFGIELYGNGLMVAPKLLKEKPEVVAGLVRAVNQGLRDAAADPDAAIEALAKREPMINRELEKRRLVYAMKTLIVTPETMKVGVGDVDQQRLERSIGQLDAAVGLPRIPKTSEVFDRRFLPPLAERQITLK